MKLFLLRRTLESPDVSTNCAYGFVVRAEDEKHAREIVVKPMFYLLDDPERPIGRWGDEGRETWTNPAFSTCEEIPLDGEAKVIIRDFVPV